MMDEKQLLAEISGCIKAGRYRVKLHTVRHMIEEGFEEKDIIHSIIHGKIIESYPEEDRCLILGEFHFTETTISPLHIVCDYSQQENVDIVTAYIPQKPWWVNPKTRGDKQ